MQINQELQALGLSATEASVYQDLAEIGRSTPQVLSKRTGIARTTVYWALDALVTKGLVALEKKRSTSFYLLNQPEALLRMVQDERRRSEAALKQKEQLARQLASSIQPFLRGHGSLVPKIHFFEGKKGVEAMLFDNLTTWQESIAQYDFTWWGYQDPSFPAHYLEWMQHTWKVKKDKEVYKVATNEEGMELNLKTLAPHRGVKFVPPEYRFSSTIWALGDYVVIIVTSQEPHYALLIQNKAIAANLRTVFSMLWELALPKFQKKKYTAKD